MRAINMQRKQGGGAGPGVSSSSWFDERCKQAEPVVACSCARLVVGSWEATRAEIVGVFYGHAARGARFAVQ
jgi:hypothetical protein